MSTEGILFFLFFVAGGVNLYGMMAKKEWYWEPQKGFKKHFILSSQFGYNQLIGFFLGKKGVVIFNLFILIFLGFILCAHYFG